MKGVLIGASALLLLFSSACAPATPTADPAMIQASAVAAANTIVAMTQAAVPTATEIPPTPLPLPSPTPFPSPTLSDLPTASAPVLPPPVSAGPTGDACQGPMSPKPSGPLKSVRIINDTGGSVVLSLYLQKTAFGECGYQSFNLVAHGSVIATDLPQGCYFGGAFVTSPKAKTKSFGNGCLNGPGMGLVTVRSETIDIGG